MNETITSIQKDQFGIVICPSCDNDNFILCSSCLAQRDADKKTVQNNIDSIKF